MVDPSGRAIGHGVILKVVSTNICGSDQHMVRGRTTAPVGLVLGHEITGEVVEIGRDVETLKLGDLVSVPFNVACGRCAMCKDTHTGVCLNVNPSRAGGAYGYVDMGGWIGVGRVRARAVCRFQPAEIPDRDQAMAKIRDLTCLSDILPTGYHGAVSAGVKPLDGLHRGCAVGMAAAASARLLGAAVTIVGDMNAERLAHARAMGFETVDLSKDASLGEQIEQILGVPEIDCAVDCVGFEAHGHGSSGHAEEAPATVLNSLMEITRPAGAIGIPGLYVTDDPGAKDKAAQHGSLSIRFGLGWAKSHSFFTGQTPVLKYNRNLMQAILFDRLPIAKIVNVEVISLDQAPEGYKKFDGGAPRKFVIDPHGLLAA